MKGIEPSSSAWKAVALPLSYTRNSIELASCRISPPSPLGRRRMVGEVGLEPTKASQRIYSPPPLPLGTLSQNRRTALISKDKRELPAGRSISAFYGGGDAVEVNGRLPGGGGRMRRLWHFEVKTGPGNTDARGQARRQARRHPRAGGTPRAFPARPARKPAAGRRRRRALRLAYGHRGAAKPGAAGAQAARHRERRPPPRRGERPGQARARDRAARRDRGAAAAGRRASGPLSRSRSPALAADRGARRGRHRAGARPDHRSAQCRRDLPLGRGLRRDRHRHHRAPQPGGDRRAGEIGLRRARACAARHGAEPRARAWPS